MPAQEKAPEFTAVASRGRLSKNQMSAFLTTSHGLEHILSAALPPLFILIKGSLGLSYTQVGLLTTVRNTMAGVIQAPAGVLVDRVGARRPLAIGFAVVSLSLILSGFAPGYLLLVLAQLLSGIGSSAFHPATYAMVTRLAAGESVGKRMGFHTFGGFIGTTASYVLVAFLGTRFGWRTALILLGIPGFVVAYLFWRLFDLPIEVARSSGDGKKAGPPARVSPLSVIPLIGITTIQGMFSRGLSAFLPLFLSVAYRMSVAQAAVYSTLMTGSGSVGLLLGGVLADRYSRLTVLAMSSMWMCLTSLVLANWTLSYPMLAVLLIASGLAQYASNPSQTSLVTRFSSADSEGSLFGLTFAGSFLGGSFVTVVAGWMADMVGVRSIFWLLAVLALGRAIMTIPLKAALEARTRQATQAAGGDD